MEPTEVVTQVIEVTQPVIDYSAQLAEIQRVASVNADASVTIAGFLLFFVIVTLCYFGYKFMRIFF